jgi:hypothetical protein
LLGQRLDSSVVGHIQLNDAQRVTVTLAKRLQIRRGFWVSRSDRDLPTLIHILPRVLEAETTIGTGDKYVWHLG